MIASIEEADLIKRILEHLGWDDEALDPAHPSGRRRKLACRSDPARDPSEAAASTARPAPARRALPYLAEHGRFGKPIERPLHVMNAHKNQRPPSHAIMVNLIRPNTLATGSLNIL
ncbi:MAG: hypothetical protein ACRDKX_09555, partial [Solirubrobacterales bacterium]